MSRDTLTLYSSVTAATKKRALFRGTALAATGALLLVVCGSFIPADLLKTVGVWIFLLCGALIAFGLLPYKRLERLETNPHKLLITDDEVLHFFRKNALIWSIPLSQIEALEYFEQLGSYGIVVKAKKGNKTLPYFSKRTRDKLVMLLQE